MPPQGPGPGWLLLPSLPWVLGRLLSVPLPMPGPPCTCSTPTGAWLSSTVQMVTLNRWEWWWGWPWAWAWAWLRGALYSLNTCPAAHSLSKSLSRSLSLCRLRYVWWWPDPGEAMGERSIRAPPPPPLPAPPATPPPPASSAASTIPRAHRMESRTVPCSVHSMLLRSGRELRGVRVALSGVAVAPLPRREPEEEWVLPTREPGPWGGRPTPNATREPRCRNAMGDTGSGRRTRADDDAWAPEASPPRSAPGSGRVRHGGDPVARGRRPLASTGRRRHVSSPSDTGHSGAGQDWPVVHKAGGRTRADPRSVPPPPRLEAREWGAVVLQPARTVRVGPPPPAPSSLSSPPPTPTPPPSSMAPAAKA